MLSSLEELADATKAIKSATYSHSKKHLSIKEQKGRNKKYANQ